MAGESGVAAGNNVSVSAKIMRRRNGSAGGGEQSVIKAGAAEMKAKYEASAYTKRQMAWRIEIMA